MSCPESACGLRADYRREPVPVLATADVSLMELPVGAEGWECVRAHLVWDATVAPALLVQPIYLTPDGRAVPAAAPFAVAGGAATVGLSCLYGFRLTGRLAAPGPTAQVFVSWVRGCSASLGFVTT